MFILFWRRRGISTSAAAAALLLLPKNYIAAFSNRAASSASVVSASSSPSSLADVHGREDASTIGAAAALRQTAAGAGGQPEHDEAVWQLKVRHHGEKELETIEIKLHKQWTPAGFQRVIDLTASDFFKDLRFFRTIRGFMSQFGLSGDPKVNAQWGDRPLPVEPPKQSNTRGMVTFAMDGRKRRTTQLFINTVDNKFLDTQGFAPVGEVISGMSVVDKFHSGYGEAPRQNLINTEGNTYLDADFPELSQLIESKIAFPDGTVASKGVGGAATAMIDRAAESAGGAAAAASKPPSGSWLPSVWTMLFFSAVCFVAFRSRRKIVELMFDTERILGPSKGMVIGSSPRRSTSRDFAL
eukprot:g5225.t1